MESSDCQIQSRGFQQQRSQSPFLHGITDAEYASCAHLSCFICGGGAEAHGRDGKELKAEVYRIFKLTVEPGDEIRGISPFCSRCSRVLKNTRVWNLELLYLVEMLNSSEQKIINFVKDTLNEEPVVRSCENELEAQNTEIKRKLMNHLYFPVKKIEIASPILNTSSNCASAVLNDTNVEVQVQLNRGCHSSASRDDACAAVPATVREACLEIPTSVNEACVETPAPVNEECFEDRSSVNEECFEAPLSVIEGDLKTPACIGDVYFEAPASVGEVCFQTPASVGDRCFDAPASVGAYYEVPVSAANMCFESLDSGGLDVSLRCAGIDLGEVSENTLSVQNETYVSGTEDHREMPEVFMSPFPVSADGDISFSEIDPQGCHDYSLQSLGHPMELHHYNSDMDIFSEKEVEAELGPNFNQIHSPKKSNDKPIEVDAGVLCVEAAGTSSSVQNAGPAAALRSIATDGHKRKSNHLSEIIEEVIRAVNADGEKRMKMEDSDNSSISTLQTTDETCQSGLSQPEGIPRLCYICPLAFRNDYDLWVHRGEQHFCDKNGLLNKIQTAMAGSVIEVFAGKQCAPKRCAPKQGTRKQSGTEQPAPEQPAPKRRVVKRCVPKQGAQKQSGTEQPAPKRRVVKRCVPKQGAQKQSGIEQPAPEQRAPEQCTPEQCTPEQCTPEQCAPEQCAPEQCAPEQCAPEQCAPEQRAPKQCVPTTGKIGTDVYAEMIEDCKRDRLRLILIRVESNKSLKRSLLQRVKKQSLNIRIEKYYERIEQTENDNAPRTSGSLNSQQCESQPNSKTPITSVEKPFRSCLKGSGGDKGGRRLVFSADTTLRCKADERSYNCEDSATTDRDYTDQTHPDSQGEEENKQTHADVQDEEECDQINLDDQDEEGYDRMYPDQDEEGCDRIYPQDQDESNQIYPDDLDQDEANQLYPDDLDQDEANQIYPDDLDQVETNQIYPDDLDQNETNQIYPHDLDQDESNRIYPHDHDQGENNQTHSDDEGEDEPDQEENNQIHSDDEVEDDQDQEENNRRIHLVSLDQGETNSGIHLDSPDQEDDQEEANHRTHLDSPDQLENNQTHSDDDVEDDQDEEENNHRTHLDSPDPADDQDEENNHRTHLDSPDPADDQDEEENNHRTHLDSPDPADDQDEEENNHRTHIGSPYQEDDSDYGVADYYEPSEDDIDDLIDFGTSETLEDSEINNGLSGDTRVVDGVESNSDNSGDSFGSVVTTVGPSRPGAINVSLEEDDFEDNDDNSDPADELTLQEDMSVINKLVSLNPQIVERGIGDFNNSISSDKAGTSSQLSRFGAAPLIESSSVLSSHSRQKGVNRKGYNNPKSRTKLISRNASPAPCSPPSSEEDCIDDEGVEHVFEECIFIEEDSEYYDNSENLREANGSPVDLDDAYDSRSPEDDVDKEVTYFMEEEDLEMDNPFPTTDGDEDVEEPMEYSDYKYSDDLNAIQRSASPSDKFSSGRNLAPKSLSVTVPVDHKQFRTLLNLNSNNTNDYIISPTSPSLDSSNQVMQSQVAIKSLGVVAPKVSRKLLRRPVHTPPPGFGAKEFARLRSSKCRYPTLHEFQGTSVNSSSSTTQSSQPEPSTVKNALVGPRRTKLNPQSSQPGPSTVKNAPVGNCRTKMNPQSSQPEPSTVKNVPIGSRRTKLNPQSSQPGPSTLKNASVGPRRTRMNTQSLQPGPSTVQDAPVGACTKISPRSLQPGPSTVQDAPVGACTEISPRSLQPGPSTVQNVPVGPRRTKLNSQSLLPGPSTVQNAPVGPRPTKLHPAARRIANLKAGKKRLTQIVTLD